MSDIKVNDEVMLEFKNSKAECIVSEIKEVDGVIKYGLISKSFRWLWWATRSMIRKMPRSGVQGENVMADFKYKVGDEVVCNYKSLSGLAVIIESKRLLNEKCYRIASTGIPEDWWFKEEFLKEQPYPIC